MWPIKKLETSGSGRGQVAFRWRNLVYCAAYPAIHVLFKMLKVDGWSIFLSDGHFKSHRNIQRLYDLRDGNRGASDDAPSSERDVQ